MRTTFLLILAAFLLSPSLLAGDSPSRKLTFNGRPLTGVEMARLETVERVYRVKLPDLAYWYDNRSGAVGLWKGPAAGFFPAGLKLGGPMPANCSGGGTGVFVNGRELHPVDVAALRRITTVLQGRWWVDANGVGGPEGGPAMFDLAQLARKANAGGWSRRVGGVGHTSSVGGDGDFFYFIDSDGSSLTIGR